METIDISGNQQLILFFYIATTAHAMLLAVKAITVNSACNNTQGTLKIISLHPDIVINKYNRIYRRLTGAIRSISLHPVYHYIQYCYKWSLLYHSLVLGVKIRPRAFSACPTLGSSKLRSCCYNTSNQTLSSRNDLSYLTLPINYKTKSMGTSQPACYPGFSKDNSGNTQVE